MQMEQPEPIDPDKANFKKSLGTAVGLTTLVAAVCGVGFLTPGVLCEMFASAS